MFDLLAQSTATGIAVGGGLGGIGIWIIRRQLRKVVEHVDDDDRHITTNNGYVTKSLCEERSGNIENRLTELHTDVREILNRTPK